MLNLFKCKTDQKLFYKYLKVITLKDVSLENKINS